MSSGGAWKWVGKHPWMTFFLVGGAFTTVRVIAVAVTGGFRGFGDAADDAMLAIQGGDAGAQAQGAISAGYADPASAGWSIMHGADVGAGIDQPDGPMSPKAKLLLAGGALIVLAVAVGASK